MKKILSLLIAVFVGACSSTSETLFGDDVAPKGPQQAESSGFDGTFMKNKLANFKSEEEQIKSVVEGRKASLAAMRNDTNAAVSEYRAAVAQINSKLQLGTTPGNPELMDEWKAARAKLENVNNIAFDIKRLVADVESDQSMVEYMAGSIQAAYKIRGATEDQHKQLRTLEDEARQLGSNISVFARQVSQEADRQQAYVDGEKFNLNDVALNIKNGKLYGVGGSQDFFADGGSMFSSDESYDAFISESSGEYAPVRRAPGPRQRRLPQGITTLPAPVSMLPVERVAAGVSPRPIAVIKFDRPNVDFDEPLYQALSRSLERNPSATFTIAGVSPKSKPSSAIRGNVKGVMDSLTSMGLPASRIALTSETDDVAYDEVRVYEK
jgi:hypothetical protein